MPSSTRPAARADVFKAFEAIFARYADVDIIARSALGRRRAKASPPQFAAYKQAFPGPISGANTAKRFHEFIGSQIEGRARSRSNPSSP